MLVFLTALSINRTMSHQSLMLTNFYQCQYTIIRQHNKKQKVPDGWHFPAFALYKQHRRVLFFSSQGELADISVQFTTPTPHLWSLFHEI